MSTKTCAPLGIKIGFALRNAQPVQPSALQRLEEWWNADEMNGYVIKSRIDYVEVMLWRDGADEETHGSGDPSPTPSTPHWMRRRGGE